MAQALWSPIVRLLLMLVPRPHWRLSTLVLPWISGNEISLWRNDEEERLTDFYTGRSKARPRKQITTVLTILST